MTISGKDQLYQSLLPYTQMERVYKKYYELRDDPRAKSAYLDEIKDYVLEKYLLIPELVYIPENFSEQSYYTHLPIGRGSHVNVSCHARYTPVFHYSTSFFEIYYVLHGSTKHTLAGEEMTLMEGDVLFIPPGMKRSIEIFDDSLLPCIHIRHDTFDDAFFNTLRYDNVISDFFMSNLYSQRPARTLFFPTGSDLDVRDIVLDMYLEAKEGDAYSWRLLNNLVAMFFVKLLRGYADRAVIGNAGRQSEKGADVLPMLSYINDNYRIISLEKLAHQFGYSVPYCSKLIREETGIGFSHFVRRVKMNHAIPLLLNTRTSVADIAVMVGYETPESFIRAFQKVYGMSPSAYRKQNQ